MAAATTRILELRGFDTKIKTRDIHNSFADFGEFKIKWIDDHSLYLVFPDAVTAKRFFLQTLGSMPPQLVPAPNSTITLTAYKGPDAQAIIAHTQRPTRNERGNSISSKAPDPVVSFANGTVSPAVSMMILAASAAGPPGQYQVPINGTNGVGYPPIHHFQQQQQMSGDVFLSHHGSNGNLRSSFSQGSIPDNFAYGLGGGLASMSGPIAGMLSSSSSWSDAAPPTNQRVAGRNPAMSLHPFGISMSRSALEDIQEASSREELPSSQVASRANSIAPVTPDHVANIVITASTPLMDTEFNVNQPNGANNLANDTSGRSSPSGKTKSDTERPGGPWLSREPSPSPSLPSLHQQATINLLVDGVEGLNIGAHSDSENRGGVHTPPENQTPLAKTATPPRIGNSGKRMLGHALGIRHPSLPPRVIAGTTSISN